jgi:hypothetical protein
MIFIGFMKIKYGHISKQLQDMTDQVGVLEVANCRRMFQEQITGSIIERPVKGNDLLPAWC